MSGIHLLRGDSVAVQDENFYTVIYWMISELGLKGAELPVFAIIYGFSQDGVNKFTGSLDYLSKFANVSRQTVIDVLKRLINADYIIKEQKVIDKVKHNAYWVNLEVVKKFDWGSQITLQGQSNNLTGGSQITLHNNISNKNIDNILIKDIVAYLNEKTGSNYKWQSRDTQKHISARINDGYTLDDFKTVIDVKSAEWLGDTKMSKFLRPSTLFGTKFESYLNQKVNKPQCYSEY